MSGSLFPRFMNLKTRVDHMNIYSYCLLSAGQRNAGYSSSGPLIFLYLAYLPERDQDLDLKGAGSTESAMSQVNDANK